MSKELFISSSPHETKVAVLEDDQLVEVYYERDTDVGLVGGIYKGRVNRVLPGMQSAFVDIGLERDAFLYVSDLFLEDEEEYDKIFEEAEARAIRFAAEEPRTTESKTVQGSGPASEAETRLGTAVAAPSPETGSATPSEAAPSSTPARPTKMEAIPSSPAAPPPPPQRFTGTPAGYRRPEHRGRRRRGRGFSEDKFTPRPESTPRAFEILPGESLAKYSHPSSGFPSPPTTPRAPDEPGTLQVNPSAQPGGSVRGPSIAPSEIGAPTEPVASEVVAARHKTATAPTTESARSCSAPLLTEPGRLGEGYAIPPSVLETTERPEAGLPPPPEIPPTAESIEPPAPFDQTRITGASPLQGHEKDPTAATPGAQQHLAEASFSEAGLPLDASTGPSSTVQTSSTQEGETSGQVAPSPTLSGEPTLQAPAQDQVVQPGQSALPPERTATLREPYQRPRYAPQRSRRGRRGMGRRPPRLAGRQEPRRFGNDQPRQIAELLKEGQEILLQIAKEPLGTKGARITSHIALPGRYLVYMPTIDHIGVSRKIASEQERLRLRNTILENKGSLSGGFIVRTAGEGRSAEEFKADLKFLSTLWNDIKSKAERSKAPALIHRDLNLVQRILRDILSPDFKTVRVDHETEYERVMEFVSRAQPSLVGQVKLYSRDAPLFEEFGIEAGIEKALKPKVWLKSGGYIVVNQTEALVAIDVNTGKYVGKTNRLEDTILKTNIDAVNEIVRQIRLRDLGGIIVIDFIDMDERRNRFRVTQALEEALRHDRAPTKVLSFHDFGLVAVTRKRVKQSLERTLCEPCEYCSGAGWIKSVATVCYQILAEARKMAQQIEGSVLTLRVNPEVAHALKSREGMLILELESITHKDVIIKSDPAVHQERFEIF